MRKQKILNTAQAAEKLGISEGRLRTLCGEGRVEGAFKIGERAWGFIFPLKIRLPANPSRIQPSKVRMRSA